MFEAFRKLASIVAGIEVEDRASTDPQALAAPVITRAATYGDIQPLQDFINALQSNGASAAEYEASRLDPFYEALSRYLRRTEEEHPEHVKPERKERTAKLSEPGTLKRLFNEVATDTKSAILSEIAIMPASVCRAREKLFPGTTGFNARYDYNGHSFDFGFIQVFQKNMLGMRQRSVAFPLLSADDEILTSLEPFGTEKLLHGLQRAGTWVNHDMLHHYTAHNITPNVAYNDYTRNPALNLPVHRWMSDRVSQISADENDSAHYETWNILAYAQMQESEGYDEINGIVDEYFAELDRIGAAWKEKAATAEDSGAVLEQAHKSTDFMGTMMGFILMRAVPFDHPLMVRYFEHMERIDPAPAHAERALVQLAEQHYERKKPDEQSCPDFLNECLGGRQPGNDQRLVRAIENYRRAGHDMLPQGEAPLSYRQVKEMQLALFDPRLAYLHSPPADGEILLARAKRDAGPVMVDFIDSVARTVRLEI